MDCQLVLNTSDHGPHICLLWLPSDVLDKARVVHMREDHLWWPVLIIFPCLFFTALRIIPNKYFAVLASRHEDLLLSWVPLQLSHLLIVVQQIINTHIRHAQVPNTNHACLLPGHCNQICIYIIENSTVKFVIRSMALYQGPIPAVTHIPDFEKTV